jgi:RNA polymerase sigma-70 factor (ECF subfamily)
VRRRGHSPEQAEDLVQGFFAGLLEKDALTAVDRGKGKFRSFLLAALTHFMANQWDKSQTLKRGGGAKVIAIDALDAEARYAVEPADKLTPERVFEQRWAWGVLDQVVQRLRQRYHDQGQDKLFEALKGSLTSGPPVRGYAELARKLGMAEGTLAVAAHRLRRRFRQLLREQIAQTVSAPELIDEEIRYLLDCL